MCILRIPVHPAKQTFPRLIRPSVVVPQFCQNHTAKVESPHGDQGFKSPRLRSMNPRFGGDFFVRCGERHLRRTFTARYGGEPAQLFHALSERDACSSVSVTTR